VPRHQAGTVWINTYNFYDPAAPFGGYKFSGFGKIWGKRHCRIHRNEDVWVGL